MIKHIQRKTIPAVFLSTFFTLASGYAKAAEPPALADIFANPSFKQVKISRDGKYLGVIVPEEEKDTLAIIDIEKAAFISKLIFRGTKFSVGHFEWVKDNKLLLHPVVTYPWNEAPSWHGDFWASNFDGSGFRLIYGRGYGGRSGWGSLVSTLENDPDNILIASHKWTHSGDTTPELLRVQLRDGMQRRVMGAPLLNARFIASPNGDVRFAVAEDKNAVQQVYQYQPESNDWRKLASNNTHVGVMEPLAVSENGDIAYYLSDEGTAVNGLFSYQFSTGERSLIYRNAEHNIGDVTFDPATHEPLWAAHADDSTVHYLKTDSQLVKLRSMLAKGFPDTRLAFTSFTKDHKKAIVFVDSDRDPGVWYSVDLETRKVKEELIANRRIDPELMQPMQRVALQARDGVKLHGYYTAKKQPDGKKPPMVLMVHGGPHAQDDWGFDPQVQALATRGYAVLQINFRGSTGYGRAFEAAGRGQWGRAMQDDLTDATTWAISQGLADPDRICIMGGSYGGYAALMGAVREPKLYQCVVDMFGVTDLELLYEDDSVADAYWGKAYLKDAIGNDPKEWIARSPARQADKIQVPVLIIAGEVDTVVPMEHSEMMEKALQKAGKVVETLYFNKEGHGFFNPVNRVKAYERILAFLDKNIGGHFATPP